MIEEQRIEILFSFTETMSMMWQNLQEITEKLMTCLCCLLSTWTEQMPFAYQIKSIARIIILL